MKKIQNTLFAMSEGLYLRQEGESVAVEKDHHVVSRFPLLALSGIVAIPGNVSISPHLMYVCSEHGISITFIDRHGQFLSRVEGPVSGNVLLRLCQVRAYDDVMKKGAVARNFALGKVANARSVLMRRQRDHGEDVAVSGAIERMKRVVELLRNAPANVETIRGLEGEAASTYFAVFDRLRMAGGDAFRFEGRNRRPPRDRMNALLSFVYTLLAHDCRGALESVGLDPQIGFLHAVRPGRASLALDLMEEFRSIVADRVVMSLVNLRQVSEKDFKVCESGAVVMSDGARKVVLSAWQKKKQERVEHPFLRENVPIGLLPYCQALLLARYLRNDLDAYPPFLMGK